MGWFEKIKKLKRRWIPVKEAFLAPLEKMGFSTHNLFPSLVYVNICQTTGVFNNNLLKILLIFFFIDLGEGQNTTTILATVGVVYVVPFLLFSSVAGKLADCTSKKKIAVFIKVSEILILLLGCYGFWIKSAILGYCSLFLLASNSAVYSPAKYGILKDLFSSDNIPVASSSVTSFTYIGIILGTFFASLLTSITDRNFTVSLFVGIGVSVVGLIAACLVPSTSPRANEQEFGFKESYLLWKQARKIPYLQICLILGSFFLFIGAFVQLNIIPFAMQQMGLSDVYGGYLFLGCAVGIALGALAIGQVLKHRVEPGITCIAGVLLSLALFTVAMSGGSPFWLVFLELMILGFIGGCFVVPCETYLQLFSPDSQRGAYFALLNWLSFVGVLLAAVAIALFGQLELMAKGSFIVLAGIVFIMMLFLIKKEIWSLFRLDEFFFQKNIKHMRNPSTWPLLIDPLPPEVLSLIAWRKRVAGGAFKTILSFVVGEKKSENPPEEEEEEIPCERALLWVFLPKAPSCKMLTPRRVLGALSPLFEENPPILFIGNVRSIIIRALCCGSKKVFTRWWNQEHLAIALSGEGNQREKCYVDDFLNNYSFFEEGEPGQGLDLLREFKKKLGVAIPFYYLQWEIEDPSLNEDNHLKHPKNRWVGKWVKVKPFL